MDRRSFAVWTVALGLVIGLVGNLFFHRKLPGLSIPLFTALVILIVLGSAWKLREHRTTPLRLRNLWPLIPLLFFAVMVAVRADRLITGLNILAVFGLGALVLHYLPQPHTIDDDTLGDYVHGGIEATANVVTLPVAQGIHTLLWMREQRPLRQGPTLAIGRGLLFTVPLLLVFAALLASADAVFAGYVQQAMRLFEIHDRYELMAQGVLIGALGWLGCGALAYGVGRALPAAGAMPVATDAAALERLDTISNSKPKSAKRHPFTLGMIESGMMLGAVNLMFGVFVLIQFAYFFGGDANISVEGYTYAQYARRGFFELVAVSVLTLGLVLALDWVTVRHSKRQVTLFRALAVVLVGLTGVMLLSASQRMWLYEQAFGFTHLRVYTHVFMLWMAVLFGVFLLALFRVRDRIFSVGTLLVIIGYLATLNVMNVEQVIAERNINRYLHPDPASAEGTRELDFCYLRGMSVDALPAMLALYRASATEPEVRELVGWWLNDQLRRLDRANETGGPQVLSYNVARASAWTTLNAMRGELPVDDLSVSRPYCRTSLYGEVSFADWD